ncbi:MAG: hypothetical protein ACM3XQ_10240 [Nocardioidaceae bacterium]
MSDQVEEPVPHDAAPGEGVSSSELTGHEVVDGVLRSLEDLGDKPVEEHVAIFESAHEQLRAALADAGNRPGGPAAG